MSDRHPSESRPSGGRFSDRRLFALMMGVGIMVLLGWAGLTNPSLATGTDAVNGPGPDLMIEIGGQTKGTIVIDLFEDVAPNHVARIVGLAEAGDYDDVIFHRVIEGFMAQTGDVQYGKGDRAPGRAGMGGSTMPDLGAEFSDRPFVRGTVGMARSRSPDSANSQFFIMFAPAPHLDGQYTVVGQVVEGMDVVDAIRKGDPGANGAVSTPDRMARVTVRRD